MENYFIIPICMILAHIFTISVDGQGYEDIQWTLLKFEGLDNVFSNAQRSDLNIVTSQDVCNGLMSLDLSTALKGNNFRSNVRGQIANPDAVPVDENGYQLFNLNNRDIYLYHCDHPDQSQKYFLTQAHDFDKVLFLFVYNYGTHEMELAALIEEDLIPLRDEPDEGITYLETVLIANHETYLEFFLNNPAENQNDPVCGLEIEQKIRLCGLLLNTEYYKSLYAFSPIPANVDGSCTSARFDAQGLQTPSGEFVENTFGCHVTNRADNTQKTIHISRSYRSNEVISSVEVQNDKYNDGKPMIKMDNVVQNIPFIEESTLVDGNSLNSDGQMMMWPEPYSKLGLGITVQCL